MKANLSSDGRFGRDVNNGFVYAFFSIHQSITAGANGSAWKTDGAGSAMRIDHRVISASGEGAPLGFLCLDR